MGRGKRGGVSGLMEVLEYNLEMFRTAPGRGKDTII